MKHKRRKIICIVLAIFMVMASACASFAWPFPEGNGVDASKCTTNATVKSLIKYIEYKYPNKTSYPGGGTCFGYATTINDLFAASNSEKEYVGLRFTKANFLKKCKGVKAGTHIRFSDSKSFNGGYGHSVVLLKVTDDMVYFTDNNYYTYNTVQYTHLSVDDFCEYYDYKYINRITKPTKYRSFSRTRVAAKAFETGNIRLNWIKTTDTTKYIVYRSYSKNGEYKKIATVKGTTYLDKKVKRNKTAYYKVESIRPSGNKTSAVISKKSK